jgi:copper(I)-binding protein
MRRLLLAMPLLCIAPLAPAQAQGIQVQDAWTRATQAGRPAAVYMAITGGPDRLRGVATDAAGRAELHETVLEDGVARMRPVAGVLVSPGAHTRMAPGGMHIMLLDLKKPLKEGDTLALTLTFERAGKATVAVPVLSPRATGPGDSIVGGRGGQAGQGALPRRQ